MSLKIIKQFSNRTAIAGAAIAVALLFFSTWNLGNSPATWFDEGINMGIAKSFLNSSVYSLPIGPDEYVSERFQLITTNFPLLIPVSFSLAIFGNSIAVARLPMVLFLFVFVVLAYFFVKKEASQFAALWSAALIVAFSPFYGNGKAVLGEVPGLVFFLAALLFLPIEFKRRRLFSAGLFFGLAATTKPFFLIIGLSLLFGELIANFNKNNIKLLLTRLVYLGIGAFLPLTIWIFTIMPEISLSGLQNTFSFYSNSYAAQSFFPLIFKNAVRFFSETTPLHMTLLVVISLYAWYKSCRSGEKSSERKRIVWIFIIINILWYLKTPGWYRYFFTAHILAFLWFPAALEKIFSKRLATVMLSVLLVVQLGYLLQRRNDPLYFSVESDTASAKINSLARRDDSVLFVNAPSLAFVNKDHKVYQFLQINPQLFFGNKRLNDEMGEPYRWLVVNGDIGATALASETQVLKQQYSRVAEEGHFVFYKHL